MKAGNRELKLVGHSYEGVDVNCLITMCLNLFQDQGQSNGGMHAIRHLEFAPKNLYQRL
jgi:hypothetical protein